MIFLDRSPLATAVVDFGDVAHLAGEVRRHQVHVVGQVLPRPADALHLGLTAELAFGADFARDARHFRGEGVELVHHGVDGVLQLQNLAFDVHGDLLRQVAVRHGRGHLGDVAHLAGEVRRHRVHVVGRSFQVPPTPFTSACPPSFPSVPTSRATRVTSEANELS